MCFMKRLVLLIFILILANSLSAQDSLKKIPKDVKYKVFLRDSSTFIFSVSNRTVYLITEYARIKLILSDIDSIDIGIVPDFRNEQRIVNLLLKLNSDDTITRKSSFEKILKLNFSALPVIRNYIDYSADKNKPTDNDKYSQESALAELMKKYKVKRDFPERDIVYMNEGFRLGGFLSVKKKRSVIKFGKLILPREDVKKILILHEPGTSINNKRE